MSMANERVERDAAKAAAATELNHDPLSDATDLVNKSRDDAATNDLLAALRAELGIEPIATDS